MTTFQHGHSSSQNQPLEPFLKFGVRIFKKKKEVVFKQGDIGDGLYYLHTGQIIILVGTPIGDPRIVDVQGPGVLLGEQGIDRKAYYSSAIAGEKSVIYYFSNDCIKNLIMQEPIFLNLLMESISQKMKVLMEEIMLKQFTSDQHIAHTLLKASMAYGGKEVGLSQQDIAKYTGLTRITVYKTLKMWKNAGIIDIGNRKILIHQPDRLLKYTAM